MMGLYVNYLHEFCEQVMFLAASVCLSVRLSAQILENYWSEIDVTWQEYAQW